MPHLSTGFSTLDTLSGCGGVPLGHMTLLSGAYTSGVETVAYKTIAAAQRVYPKQAMAVVSLHEISREKKIVEPLKRRYGDIFLRGVVVDETHPVDERREQKAAL